MLFSRLAWKFVLLYGTVYGLCAVGCVLLILDWRRSDIVRDLDWSLGNIARQVTEESDDPNQQADAARQVVRRFAARFQLRIRLLDRDGRVLMDSARPPETVHAHEPLPLASAGDRERGLSIGREPVSLRPMVNFVYWTGRSGPVAVVHLALAWQPYQEVLDRLRERLLLMALGGGVVLLFLTVVLVRPLSRGALQLAGGARALARGDFNIVVDARGADEMALAAKSFREMALEVESQIDRLRAHSERLTLVLGTMTEGVVALDNRGTILFANRAARTLLEFATPEPVGRAFIEAVRNPEVHGAVERALSDREPRTSEVELGSHPRRIISLHIRRLPGKPTPGVLLVVHDVTDLRRLENLRQEFVANVSHELKTPLTVIKAYAETLLDGAIHDAQNNTAFVRQIAEQAERLHQLILDLLSVARIESGHERFEFAPVDVRRLVGACIERHTPAAESKRVQLSQRPGHDGLSVFADEEGVQEILDNLIDNAIKYTPQGGRVTVGWHTDNGMVAIEVCDTGIGIPADHQPRIFERFYRVDKARSRELGGTGLGLSIVKHLVSSFGGTINLESEVDRGSTFTVRLPSAS